MSESMWVNRNYLSGEEDAKKKKKNIYIYIY